MPFEVTASGPDIPDGTYKAQLIRVESGIKSQYGNVRKWFFLVDVNGRGEELSALTSEDTSSQSKAGKWLAALLGRPLVVGETVEDPTGKTVLVDIVRNKKDFPSIGEMRPFSEPTQVEAGIPR